MRIAMLLAALLVSGCASKDDGWNEFVFGKIQTNAPLQGEVADAATER